MLFQGVLGWRDMIGRSGTTVEWLHNRLERSDVLLGDVKSSTVEKHDAMFASKLTTDFSQRLI